MRERRRLRVAGRAAGELDIDRVIGRQRCRDSLHVGILRRSGQIANLGVVKTTGGLFISEADDRSKRGRFCCLQFARLGAGQFRRQRVQHAQIITGLKLRRRNQGRTFDFIQRIFEFR